VISNYIRGKVQELKYGSSATRIWFTPSINGKEVTPTSAPHVTLYDKDGTAVVGPIDMTAATPTDEGFLAFDAMTSKFVPGEVVTGGTSHATGAIVSIDYSGTTGILTLIGVSGTFANNEALTGDQGGAATEDLALFSRDYFYAATLAATSTWPLGESYRAAFSFEFNSLTWTSETRFDVVRMPFDPINAAEDVDRVHAAWATLLPEGWESWQAAVEQGHAELAMEIRQAGKRPAFVVNPEELRGLEMAYISAVIARQISQFKAEERKYWAEERDRLWELGQGLFHYDLAGYDTETPEADEDIHEETMPAKIRR